MSNELQSVLDDIKLDKQTNLKPENIKGGVTVLGVTGTLIPTENLQEQLDAQDVLIEELQTELENKAKVGYNTKAEFVSTETYWDGMYTRYITEVDIDIINKIINNFDSLANINNDNNLFLCCSGLHSIPLFDTSSLKTFKGMFKWCDLLEEIPLFDTSGVENMYEAFRGCRSVTTFPLFDTSKVTTMHRAFSDCDNLVTMPLIDLTSVTSTNYMFSTDPNLRDVPVFDLSSATSVYLMFKDCPSLSDESLNNIMQSLLTSKVNTHTLKNAGLSEEQATKCTTLSNYEAFTAAGWTTGY